MLAKPRNGWSSISLFDFQAEASYLVDIPFEWLQTCKYGIENRLPITLFIDEEGSEEYITSYYDVTHIIVDRDDEIQCLTYRKYDFMDCKIELRELHQSHDSFYRNSVTSAITCLTFLQ